jgi:hypothetical protein
MKPNGGGQLTMIQKRSSPLSKSKLERKDSGMMKVFPLSPKSLVVGGEFLNLSHAYDISGEIQENCKNGQLDLSGFKSSLDMQLAPPTLESHES